MRESDPKVVAPPASREIVARRVAATLDTVAAAGLLSGRKGKRISGRAHDQLFAAAVARSGLNGSDLIEYALAKVALEDDFTERLLSLKGSIAKDIDLEF